MVANGRAVLRSAAWLVAIPGAAIAVTVLAVSLVGDGNRRCPGDARGHPAVTALLEVADLTVAFAAAPAVDRVDLSIRQGEIVG